MSNLVLPRRGGRSRARSDAGAGTGVGAGTSAGSQSVPVHSSSALTPAPAARRGSAELDAPEDSESTLITAMQAVQLAQLDRAAASALSSIGAAAVSPAALSRYQHRRHTLVGQGRAFSEHQRRPWISNAKPGKVRGDKRRPIEVCDKAELEDLLAHNEGLLKNGSAIASLPDGGAKLRDSTSAIQARLSELSRMEGIENGLEGTHIYPAESPDPAAISPTSAVNSIFSVTSVTRAVQSSPPRRDDEEMDEDGADGAAVEMQINGSWPGIGGDRLNDQANGEDHMVIMDWRKRLMAAEPAYDQIHSRTLPLSLRESLELSGAHWRQTEAHRERVLHARMRHAERARRVAAGEMGEEEEDGEVEYDDVEDGEGSEKDVAETPYSGDGAGIDWSTGSGGGGVFGS